MKIAITGKGGVGKTTLAGTLARIFAEDGFPVLAIDADPDMNLASAIGIRNPPAPLTEQKRMIEERAGTGMGGVFKLNPKVDDIARRFGTTEHGVSMLTMGTIDTGIRMRMSGILAAACAAASSAAPGVKHRDP